MVVDESMFLGVEDRIKERFLLKVLNNKMLYELDYFLVFNEWIKNSHIDKDLIFTFPPRLSIFMLQILWNCSHRGLFCKIKVFIGPIII